MRKEIHTNWQTSPRTARSSPVGCGTQAHSAFSPQWCLVAVLLLGALCTHTPMALDRGLTPPKQDQLLSAFPKFWKAPSRARPAWPGGGSFCPQSVAIPTVAVPCSSELTATERARLSCPGTRLSGLLPHAGQCQSSPGMAAPRGSWREWPHHLLLLWPQGHRQASVTSGEGRAVPGAADSPLTFPQAGESSAKPAQTFLSVCQAHCCHPRPAQPVLSQQGGQGWHSEAAEAVAASPIYSFRARGRSGRCSSAGGSSSVGSSS